MNPESIIDQISKKDADFAFFAKMAIELPEVRQLVIDQMLTHPHIMVYYHCFYVIEIASQENAELFYPDWPRIAGLLDHENSYHRDFGLILLANLIAVDRSNLFDRIAEKYFSHLNDEKFMTAECCLRSSLKILQSRPDHLGKLLPRLFALEQHCDYPPRQIELLKWHVLELVDTLYAEIEDRQAANQFIHNCKDSLSPKTRKKARELAQKYPP